MPLLNRSWTVCALDTCNLYITIPEDKQEVQLMWCLMRLLVGLRRSVHCIIFLYSHKKLSPMSQMYMKMVGTEES